MILQKASDITCSKKPTPLGVGSYGACYTGKSGEDLFDRPIDLGDKYLLALARLKPGRYNHSDFTSALASLRLFTEEMKMRRTSILDGIGQCDVVVEL